MNRKTIIFVAILCFLLLTSVGINYTLYHKTLDLLLQNDAYIVTNILEHHPELESEVMDSVLDSFQIDYDKLESYGITKEMLPYLIEDDSLKNEMITWNAVVLLLILGVILGYALHNYWIRHQKLKEIDHYMSEILRGNESLDIRDYEEGDYSKLKNDIYKVTIKLREAKDASQQSKKELQHTLQDISHQLKTPLTSMNVLNELLEKDLPKEKRKELCAKNRDQLDRIEWLVTSLLKISMLDSGTVTLKKEKLLVKDLVLDAVKTIQIPIELKGLELKMEIPDKLTAKLDHNWTVEALLNIIKNAYEHTEKGTITITATDNPIYTQIVISDTGCGIPESDIHHIFERFYRGKSTSKESIGIGLNMSKKIINLEQGDISVSSKQGEGTTFTIQFYKN